MNAANLQPALGQAIRKVRISQGYGQDGFANTIGKQRAHYSSIERGERNLALATLQHVSDLAPLGFDSGGKGCSLLCNQMLPS